MTQEYLKSILDYDKETGIFRWKKKVCCKVVVGKIAGYKEKRGYTVMKVDKKQYRAHRLAYLYVYGKLPNNHIDHINQDKTDDRICNLRDVSQKENNRNVGIQKNNASGVTGVWWNKRKNRWIAEIKVNYKKIHLGSFKDIQKAKKARKEADVKYGFHPNHGY